MDTVAAREVDPSAIPVVWKNVPRAAGPSLLRGRIGALEGTVFQSGLVGKSEPAAWTATALGERMGNHASEAEAKAAVEARLRDAAVATLLASLGIASDARVPAGLIGLLRDAAAAAG